MLKDLNSHWEKLVSPRNSDGLLRKSWKLNEENDKIFGLYSMLEWDQNCEHENFFEIYNRTRVTDPLDNYPNLFKKVIK